MEKRTIKPASQYVDLDIDETFVGTLEGIGEIDGTFGPRDILEMSDDAGRQRRMGVGGYLRALIPELVIGQRIEIRRTADRPTSKGSAMKTYVVKQWPVESRQGQAARSTGSAPF